MKVGPCCHPRPQAFPLLSSAAGGWGEAVPEVEVQGQVRQKHGAHVLECGQGTGRSLATCLRVQMREQAQKGHPAGLCWERDLRSELPPLTLRPGFCSRLFH